MCVCVYSIYLKTNLTNYFDKNQLSTTRIHTKSFHLIKKSISTFIFYCVRLRVTFGKIGYERSKMKTSYFSDISRTSQLLLGVNLLILFYSHLILIRNTLVPLVQCPSLLYQAKSYKFNLILPKDEYYFYPLPLQLKD